MVLASDKHGNTASREVIVNVRDPEPAAGQPAAEQYTYILNTNTNKFHRPGCYHVKKMNDSNKSEVTTTREEVISWGYNPCQVCNP